MRHSRRAVMTEHYKLYMKKHIFNGKYFVRNVQIGICSVAVTALLVGAVAVTHVNQDSEKSAVDAKISIKEALFGNTEEEHEVTRELDVEKVALSTTEQATTKRITTEAVTTEFAITEKAATTEAVKNEKNDLEEAASQSELEGKCIANVEESLNIRKEPSTDAEFVGSMNAGAIAKVLGTEGEWTKIKSGDVEGYVLTEFILIGENAEELAAEHVTLVGTILEDGVNIRTEQSTDASILTVLNKDDTISVLGSSKEQFIDSSENKETDTEHSEEASTEQFEVISEVQEDVSQEASEQSIESVNKEDTDENTTSVTESSITEAVAVLAEQNSETDQQSDSDEEDTIEWISVMLEDGQTGYIASDFLDVDKLYEVAVSAEELERRAEEARRLAEEEAARQAAEEAARQAATQAVKTSENVNTSSNTTSNSSASDSTSYSGATTTPVTATESGECLGTFTITAYCGCSQCSCGHNRTASGTVPTEGRTIAADTSILPFGTQVVIDGVVYTVEDCGSGVVGNHIDIFFATHESAIAFGKRSVSVYKY